jgi:transposase
MSVRRQLSDEQWVKVEAFLEAEYKVGEPGRDDRNFIEAVLWWRRTGAPWRDPALARIRAKSTSQLRTPGVLAIAS